MQLDAATYSPVGYDELYAFRDGHWGDGPHNCAPVLNTTNPLAFALASLSATITGYGYWSQQSESGIAVRMADGDELRWYPGIDVNPYQELLDAPDKDAWFKTNLEHRDYLVIG